MPQESFAQFIDGCLRQSRHSGTRMVLMSALAAGIWPHAAVAGGGAPMVTTATADANVAVGFPAASLGVGDKKSFSVKVAPADGKAPPSAVRGRFGMPDHGHWVTDEQTSTFNGDELKFDGEFPMPGVYRFRIWLDYADGKESKTAIDFTVEPDKPLAPKVVP